MSRQTPKRRSTKASPSSYILWGGLAVLLILVIGGVIWSVPALNPFTPSETPTSAAVYTGVTRCRRQPPFLIAQNFPPNTQVGTALAGFVGFTLNVPPTDTEPGGIFQDPTWDDAGNLGAFTLDREGNIYVIPVPLTSLELNPPEEQTILYRIDGQTGIMVPVLELPPAAPPSTNNPFGLVALTYDCDTHSLYVSSLAGSTATEERGRIYQIDLETETIMNQFDNIDALGIGIFNGANGKRLYFGSARQPQVSSIPLNDQGAFSGSPTPEFSLSTIPGISNQRARRFDFNQSNTMTMRTVEFNYSLRIASQPRINVVTMSYDPAVNSWDVQEISPITSQP